MAGKVGPAQFIANHHLLTQRTALLEPTNFTHELPGVRNIEVDLHEHVLKFTLDDTLPA